MIHVKADLPRSPNTTMFAVDFCVYVPTCLVLGKGGITTPKLQDGPRTTGKTKFPQRISQKWHPWFMKVIPRLRADSQHCLWRDCYGRSIFHPVSALPLKLSLPHMCSNPWISLAYSAPFEDVRCEIKSLKRRQKYEKRRESSLRTGMRAIGFFHRKKPKTGLVWGQSVFSQETKDSSSILQTAWQRFASRALRQCLFPSLVVCFLYQFASPKLSLAGSGRSWRVGPFLK